MSAQELIYKRWSPVAFAATPVDVKTITSLFEMAGWAPSSYNAQPWKFIYGLRGDDMYPLLLDLINEGNRVWAQTAPALFLVMADTEFPGRKRLNRHAWYDTGMAMGNLMLAATEMDLYLHQMGGFDVERSAKALALPSNIEPVAMAALGFKGDPSELPEDVAARESKKRTRKPVVEFVLNSAWPVT